MKTSYNIKYQRNQPYIIYNPNYLQKAVINGEAIEFNYIPGLTAERDNKSYNMLENIHEIEPIILKEALCNMPDNFERSSKDIISKIVYFIAKNINTTHSNYHQYLDVFDMCISQNMVSEDSINQIEKFNKVDFTLKILHSVKLMPNEHFNSNYIENIINLFQLNSDNPNHEGYTIITKLLDETNTPQADIYKKGNEKLAKIFCINHVKYRDITEAKKFFKIYNFSTQTKRDIFKIAKEIDLDIYQEIFNFDLKLTKIKSLIHSMKYHDLSSFYKIITSVDIPLKFIIKDALMYVLTYDKVEYEVIEHICNILEDSYNDKKLAKSIFNKALLYAVKNDCSKTVELLINKGDHDMALSEKTYDTALLTVVNSIKQESDDIVKLLLEAGANIHAKSNDYSNDTALILIINKCSSNQYAMKILQSILLPSKVDLNITSPIKHTPLTRTLDHYNCDTKLIKLLIESGANVNLIDECSQKTPLMYAICKNCDIKIIDLLLEKGADVNTKSPYGSTALSFLFDYHLPGNLSQIKKILTLFLNHGLDISQTDNQSVIDAMAERYYNNTEVIAFLEKIKIPTNTVAPISTHYHDNHDNALQSENNEELEIAGDNHTSNDE